jgi:hypothetical protein
MKPKEPTFWKSLEVSFDPTGGVRLFPSCNQLDETSIDGRPAFPRCPPTLADLLVRRQERLLCGLTFVILPENFAEIESLVRRISSDRVRIVDLADPRTMRVFQEKNVRPGLTKRLEVLWGSVEPDGVVVAQLDSVFWLLPEPNEAKPDLSRLAGIRIEDLDQILEDFQLIMPPGLMNRPQDSRLLR